MKNKPDTIKYGGIGSDAVMAKTGKGWDEWLKVLRKEKAEKLSHKDIAILLHEKFKLDGWWAQMVTVGFEQANNLRVKNQRPDGDFSVDVSKVIPASLKNVYSFFSEEGKRKKWLKEKFEIRTARVNKSIRANFGKSEANLAILFYEKGSSKSQIVITEAKLKSSGEVESRRNFWKGAIDKLETALGK